MATREDKGCALGFVFAFIFMSSVVCHMSLPFVVCRMQVFVFIICLCHMSLSYVFVVCLCLCRTPLSLYPWARMHYACVYCQKIKNIFCFACEPWRPAYSVIFVFLDAIVLSCLVLSCLVSSCFGLGLVLSWCCIVLVLSYLVLSPIFTL